MALAKLFFPNDADFELLSSRLPHVFNGAINGLSGRVVPRFDIVQKEDTVTVLAELPGISKEDIKIDLVKDRLTISGATKEEKDYTDDAHITHRERSFGSFTRALQIPNGVKPQDIKASMENGVLKITLPAKPEQPEVTNITIS